jgi:hypothetical protein
VIYNRRGIHLPQRYELLAVKEMPAWREMTGAEGDGVAGCDGVALDAPAAILKVRNYVAGEWEGVLEEAAMEK